MLAISSLACKQLHNYPDCLRPFLRGFRFLSSTNCDPCWWLRPSAYPKDSRRIPQKHRKPLVPRCHTTLSSHLRNPVISLFEKLWTWRASVAFHVLFSVGLTITRIVLHMRPSVIFLLFYSGSDFLLFVFHVGTSCPKTSVSVAWRGKNPFSRGPLL